jgi:hypothetical protein
LGAIIHRSNDQQLVNQSLMINKAAAILRRETKRSATAEVEVLHA